MQYNWETLGRMKVLRIVFKDLSVDEFNKQIPEATKIITEQPEDSVYLISEYKNVKFNLSSIKLLNAAAKNHRKHIKFSAMLLEGILRYILDGASKFTGRKNMQAFDSELYAKKWIREKFQKVELDEARAV